MQNRVKWTTALVGIAIVGLFVVSFLPASSFVGGARASTPAASASPASGGASPTVTKQSVTPHSGNYGPHPGTLEIWEATNGGPSEADPSVCYYTVCDEPISNVYETLIAYNGTDDGPTPASYVPQLATCVPGSLECAAQFGGNDLVYDNNTTGAPQYYTFEIDSGAHFYDHANGASWQVYPSDVLFTMARTMGFADLPYEEATNGWINTQDIVAGPCTTPVVPHCANHAWDGATHFPLNNTPQNILNGFLINDSYYCPTSPIVTTTGCITFNVGPSGHAWPFFLELVADDLGGAIQPCGWYTANGGAVPGFTGTNASNGDGPCLLPGYAHSTQDPGYQNYVSSTPETGWDTFEQEALAIPAVQPGVQWNEVGSGPYYVDNPINPDVGYTLHANPAYQAPVGCAGQPGCMPVAGSYIANADIVWEASGDQTGINEMQAGQADSSGFFSTETAEVLGFSNYNLISGVPSLSVFFDVLNLNFSVTNYDAQAPPASLNVPATFFQNVALRNFLVNAYPYTAVDNTYNTVDGIAFGEDYGGAIPHGMGDYYPTNITWPSGNPVSSPTTPGNVAWWWAQANNPSSPYYDPQLAPCTPSTPCIWDDFVLNGNTPVIGEYNLWNQEIFNLTSGALNPSYNQITGQEEITDLGSPAGQNPMPTFPLGWAPDYPDPADYMAPMYYPDNSYTAPDAVSETLQAAPNNDSSCPHDYGAWSNLTYYANIGELPTGCQGAAYDTMVAWMNAAQFESNVPYRTLEYNLIEHIGALLGLYVYNPQGLTAVDYGNWIEGSTINLSPIFGGGGVQLWFDWGYAANYFDATFNEAGLGNSPTWSVNINGNTYPSQGSSQIVVSGLVNGTYPYTIPAVAGYLETNASGSIVINGASATQLVTFTAITGHVYPVTFSESGLKTGTAWTVIVTATAGGGTTLNGNTTTLVANLPNGSYTYKVNPVTGYNTPAAGAFNVTGAPVGVSVAFTGIVFHTYTVTFSETGLSGLNWAVTVNGTVLKGTTATLTTTLGNGSWSWGVVTVPTGYTVSPSAGTFSITGAAVSVAITFTATTTTTTSSSPAWTYLSTLAWILIGVLALLVIIFLALALMAGRRPPSNPPESWSSSSSSTTEMKDNKGGGT
jgi:hypothetical protein